MYEIKKYNHHGLFFWGNRIIVKCLILFVALYFTNISPVYSACTPDQRVEYFYGILWNIKLYKNDELRAYFIEDEDEIDEDEIDEDEINVEDSEEIEEVIIGNTSDNPGRLEKINDRIEFSIYLCGEDLDLGKKIQFRYARGNTEYEVDVTDPEEPPFFWGQQIDLMNIPDIVGSGLVLKVTRRIVGAGEEEAREPVWGDLNGDYKVDSSDAAIVLHHILFEGADDLKYDINKDGRVNDDDVKEIYRISNGYESSGSPFKSPESPFTAPSDSPFESPESPFTAPSDSPFESPESPFTAPSDSPFKSPESPFTPPSDAPF